MTFVAGLITGVLATFAVSIVVAVVIGKVADSREDQIPVDLWTKPWPPRPDPITEVAPTPAEQAAGVVDDLAARRKARP